MGKRRGGRKRKRKEQERGGKRKKGRPHIHNNRFNTITLHPNDSQQRRRGRSDRTQGRSDTDTLTAIISLLNIRGVRSKATILEQYVHFMQYGGEETALFLLTDVKVAPMQAPSMTGFPSVEPKRGTAGALRGVHAYVNDSWSHLTSPLTPDPAMQHADIQWIELRTATRPIAVGLFYAPGSYHSEQDNDDFFATLHANTAIMNKTHDILLMGDGNAHIPDVTNTTQPLDRNGRHLQDIARLLKLQFINGSDVCKGGTFTYFDGSHSTAIDYVMASADSVDRIESLNITTDTLGSDHYVLTVRVKTAIAPQDSVKKGSMVREHPTWREIDDACWDKIRQTYSTRAGSLRRIPGRAAEDMMEWENLVCSCIDMHATRLGDTIPDRKRKPVQNKSIIEGLGDSRSAHEGMLADPSSHESNRATQTDAALRAASAAAVGSDRAIMRSTLDKLYFSNNTLFWRTIAGVTRSSSQSLPDVLLNDRKQTISSKDGRRRAWYDRFHSMSRPKNGEDVHFDQEWKEELRKWSADRYENKERSNKEDKESGADNSITAELITKVLSSLKDCHPGRPGITKTFLLEILKVAMPDFQRLFQAVWNAHAPPTSWKTTHTLPMHKKGSRHKTKNYRPIVPLGIIAKIHDKIIDLRIREAVASDKPDCIAIDDEQAGFRKGRGPMGQVYVVLAASQMRLHRGQRTYLALLDIQGAYDRTPRDGAFYLLHKAGVGGLTFDNIVDSYKGRKTRVYLGDGFSDWITHTDGVLQGAITSPIIFIIFINPLIKALKAAGIGVRIGGTRSPSGAKIGGTCTPGVLFADDVVIIARSAAELQKALDVVTKWANKWRMTFGADKCKIIIVGGPAPEKEEWTLQGRTVKTATSEKLLGVLINYKGTVNKDHVALRVRSALYSIRRMADSGVRAWGMAPIAITSLNRCIIESVLGYGICFVQDNKESMDSLSIAQGKVAKRILGVGDRTSTRAALAILGWLPIKYLVAIERVRVYLRIARGGEGPCAQALLMNEQATADDTSRSAPPQSLTMIIARDFEWLQAGLHTDLLHTEPKAAIRWLKQRCIAHAEDEWVVWSGDTAPIVRCAARTRTAAPLLLPYLEPPAIAATRTTLLLEMPATPSWPIRCNLCQEVLQTGTTTEHVMSVCPVATPLVWRTKNEIIAATHTTRLLTDLEWAAIISAPVDMQTIISLTGASGDVPAIRAASTALIAALNRI
jgi:exonuclease III